MKPLLFLQIRQIVNGVKRAIRSPRRLIGFLFFLLWIGGGPLRTLFMGRGFVSTTGPESEALMRNIHLQNPIGVVTSAAFLVLGAFCTLSVLSLTAYRGTFNMPDVDVLFPTPIDAKTILKFRILRDSLLTILVPLIFTLIFFAPAAQAVMTLREQLSIQSVFVSIRLMYLAFLIMSASLVTLGYGITMYLNRPVRGSEVQLRAAIWMTMMFPIIVIGVFLLGLHQQFTVESVITSANSPVLRVILFPAYFAANFATVPITHNWAMFALSIAVFALMITASFQFALSQAKWLYEISSMRAAALSEMMGQMKQGAVYGSTLNRARKGKLRAVRLGFLNRWTPTGVMALVWRDLVVQARTQGLFNLLLPIGLAIFPKVIIMIQTSEEVVTSKMGIIAIFMLHTLALAANTAQIGFAEFLKRVDTLKPLPFRSAGVALAEILGKSATAVLGAILGFSLAAVLYPDMVWYAIAGVIFVVPATVLNSSVTMIITVLLPDVEDPTQRSFRGLVQMLAMMASWLLPLGTYLGLMFGAHAQPLIASLTAQIFMIPEILLCSFFAGKVYESFNPKE